jgi:hypothetical protein
VNLQQLLQIAAENHFLLGVAQELRVQTRSTVTGQFNGLSVP